ncbi:MAG: hypothetical protein ABEN55_08655 [Bradymonadaceae bacterium]
MPSRDDLHATISPLLLLTMGWAAYGLVACQSGLGSDCTSDSDCRSGRVCAGRRCSKTCTGDRDCSRPGYECRPYEDPDEDETLDICQPPVDAGAGDASGCRTDRACRRRLDADRAQCGINRRCIVPTAPPRYGLLIRDRTSTESNEESQDAGPGADIAAAVVAASDQPPTRAYAFGETLDYRPTDRVETDTTPLDGTAPDWNDGGTCVQGERSGATASLGGRGVSLLVRFLDGDGEWASLRGGSRVTVVEWGPNCGTSKMPRDTYRVDLCVSYEETIEPDRHCRRRLGTGSGLSTFTLPDDLGS